MSTRKLTPFVIAAALGLSAAVLVSCGGSGKGLIPVADAGPLQGDFEAVAQAAQIGDGNCSATTTAIEKTERDLQALPATVNAGLRSRLTEGVKNLRERALALCEQPIANTSTGALTTTTQTQTTSTNTQTTPATTTSTTATTPPPVTTTSATTTTPPPGGGTPAPGEGAGEGAPAENEAPAAPGSSGGTGQGPPQ